MNKQQTIPSRILSVFILLVTCLLFVQCGPTLGDAKKKMKSGDINGAVEVLVEMAEKGNEEAINMLAEYCLEIDDTPKVSLSEKSKQAALPWLEKCAESWSNADVARLVSYEYGMNNDDENQMKWALVGAKKGDWRCAYTVGRLLKEKGRYDEAIPYLEKGTEDNWGYAYYYLSQIYLNPKYHNANEAKGIEYLVKAAENDCKDAMYDVSIRYALGDGVPENSELARKYFKNSGRVNAEREEIIEGIYKADQQMKSAKESIDKLEKIQKITSPGSTLLCTKSVAGGEQKITFKKDMSLQFEYKDEALSFTANIKYYIDRQSFEDLEPTLKFISVLGVTGLDRSTATDLFKDKFITLSLSSDHITVSGLKIMAGTYRLK